MNTVWGRVDEYKNIWYVHVYVYTVIGLGLGNLGWEMGFGLGWKFGPILAEIEVKDSLKRVRFCN